MLIVTPTPKEIMGFFNKISIDQITGCWNWTGAHNSKGYGNMRYNKKTIAPHRVMYAWLRASIPTGNGKNIPELDHVVCKNRGCCNPFHLELVLHKENILRGYSPSAIHARKKTCKEGHLLPDEYTIVNKKGKRERKCIICRKNYHREYMRKYRSSHKI